MWFLVFILGLIIGSFLNAYIFRLHKGADSQRFKREVDAKYRLPQIWQGRSVCPKCQRTLCWYELIPLLSFILQSGRCRGCKQKIDWQYPLIELATGVLFVLGIWNLEFISDFEFRILDLLKYWYFVSVLMVLFVYDLRYGLIPDRVVLSAIVISLLLNTILSWQNFILHTTYYILATLIGAVFFAIQYYSSRGRWVGAGDIRFGALMGAMVGWPQVIVALITAYLIGGFVGAILLLTGKKKFGQTVPLGTFLALGTVITLLFGEQLWQFYFSF